MIEEDTKILIIDDVKVTGATMLETNKRILLAGGNESKGFCLGINTPFVDFKELDSPKY